MENSRGTRRYPLWVYLLVIICLGVSGLYVSLHLTYTHYANYNILSYQSFCALTQSINCDTVAQSRFSILFGVPVAAWGVIGYLFILFLVFPALLKSDVSRIWPLLFILSIIYSIVSLIYGFISIRFAHSICILCLASYAVNFSLFIVCLIIKQRYSIRFMTGLLDALIFMWKNKKKAGPVGFLFLCIVGGIIAFYPQYWRFSDLPSSKLFHHGITEDGSTWIGAESPLLTITEFTDYQCFPCKKTHLALRKLIRQYPDKIRLVHRHFPMCSRCNPIVKEKYHDAACAMALIAICASDHGKFWPVSDSLFFRYQDKDKINVKELAGHHGLDFSALRSCIDKKESFRVLLKDIRYGLELGVRVTPSFIIDKKLYAGQIPTKALNRYLAQIKGK